MRANNYMHKVIAAVMIMSSVTCACAPYQDLFFEQLLEQSEWREALIIIHSQKALARQHSNSKEKLHYYAAVIQAAYVQARSTHQASWRYWRTENCISCLFKKIVDDSTHRKLCKLLCSRHRKREEKLCELKEEMENAMEGKR